MAKYTAHHAVNIYDSPEDAAAGLEAMIDAVDVTRLNLNSGIVKTDNGKYAGWIVYTDEA